MTGPIDSTPSPAPCGTPGALMRYRTSTAPKKSGGERARNKYPGNCEFCGAHIPAGAGCIEKKSDGSGWGVLC